MKPLAILLFLAAAFLPAHAQDDPQADPAELPRIPPTSPADAPATFELRPGFALELAASEPLVVDPIDIQFDEHGRLFVVEMRGYSERREEALDRIKLLVDDNDDGIFDRATIYAEDLKWPTSVCCYDGGVFVAASPDIYYFKDTDGDGVSDKKQTVFTGFGLGVDRLNMQALLNSLKWGPDNRIWGATARNGGRVRRPDQSENEALDLRGADFSFDPRTLDLRAENGTAQFGMSFDSQGRRYVCSNSNHLQWVAWERSWLANNPYHKMPAPLVSIADDGDAAPVFRISPDEPWRIVRTRWRAAGVVEGSVEGGGRVSGYFTAATGVTIYSGDAFPAEYRDSAFIGDAGSNLVHHKIIRNDPGALQPLATRLDGEAEKQTEFLRSTDNWFRPVNFANGPDGCLYICDMYREVIEHPWSIPEGIKQHLDLNSGNDRGRIWRIVPAGFKRPAFTLEDRNTNGWQQRTARRLAFEAGQSTAPLRTSSTGTLALRSPKGEEWDPWALAFALHELDTPSTMARAWERKDAPPGFHLQLAEMIARTGDKKTIRLVIEDLAATGFTPASGPILLALLDGLRSEKLALTEADPAGNLAPLFAAARANATDTSAPEGDRATALHLLRSREDFAALLLENWPSFSTDALKSIALSALASHPASLLEAVQSGAIPKEDIPLNTAALLRDHRDPAVRKLAAGLFPEPETIDRDKIVQRYAPSLQLAGDPVRGAAVYKTAACITCHRSPSGEGFTVGPDLATFKTAGPESILKNLFDPNAEVAPQYQAYTFNLDTGETLLGIIASEDATDVTLRMAGGLERTFPRKEVQSMTGLKKSLMPEGLEAALTNQDVADLLAYIANSAP